MCCIPLYGGGRAAACRRNVVLRGSESRFTLQYVDDGSRGNGRVSAGERIPDSWDIVQKAFPFVALVTYPALAESDGFGAQATSI